MIRKLCRNRVNQIFLDYIPNVDSILQVNFIPLKYRRVAYKARTSFEKLTIFIRIRS